MKKFIGIIFIMIMPNAFAAKPPSQNVVDQYIALAESHDVEVLQGQKSKWECSFPMIHTDPTFIGRAKTSEEAIQRLQLVCIKSQCQNLGIMAQKGVDRLNALSDQEYRDFLEFSGMTPEEIEIAFQTRDKTRSVMSMTCETATPAYRTLAFDSCFAVPVECKKSGRL